jgi:hypothetical protein
MKQLLKLLIFQSLLFCQENFVFNQFLNTYKFKIFSSKKQVGFINLKISSCSVQDENKNLNDSIFVAELESYTDIPILFFIGETYNYEVEYYDNNFVPKRSKIVTKDKKNEHITTMQTEKFSEDKYRCLFKKENKKVLTKETYFSQPIITAGNAIPLVTTLWNFEKERTKKFYFIDKDKLEIKEMKLEYLGETKDGLFKIKLILPYFAAKFVLYLDKDKNIKFAEGLGLEIYAVE